MHVYIQIGYFIILSRITITLKVPEHLYKCDIYTSILKFMTLVVMFARQLSLHLLIIFEST